MKKPSNAKYITFKSVSDCMEAERKARADVLDCRACLEHCTHELWLFVNGLADLVEGKQFDTKSFLENAFRKYVTRIVRDRLVLRSAELFFEGVNQSHVS